MNQLAIHSTPRQDLSRWLNLWSAKPDRSLVLRPFRFKVFVRVGSFS